VSTETGRQAEDAAAQFLQKQGLKIIERNWRTRWCEIDIIAQRKSDIYFVEVKYRQNPAFGGGLDYITPRKVAQMRYAAEFWLSGQRQTQGQCRMSAIELTGKPPVITAWLPDID